MTSAPADPPASGGNVVPLRAAEAPTEVRLDEDQAAAAAYVDLTGGEAQRAPAHPRALAYPGGREAARQPAPRPGTGTAPRTTGCARRRTSPRRSGSPSGAWSSPSSAGDRLVAHPRHGRARARGRGERAAERPPADPQGRAKETRKARGTILALCLAGLAAAVVAMVVFAPWWGVGARRRRAVRAFALAGRPQGKTITTQGRAARAGAAARPGRHHPRARLAGHRRDQPGASREASRARRFPSPVREDGPGWRLEVDLPYGVTATQVIERREQLASGLRRPLGAVWPEPVTSEHAGRLELWVGRADISKAKPAAVAVAADRRR